MRATNRIKPFKKKKTIIYAIIAIVSLCIIFLLCNYCNGTFDSDYASHIRHSLRGEGYSLIHIVSLLSNKLFGNNVLFILFMTAMNVGTTFTCAYLIKRFCSLMTIEIDRSKIIIYSLSSLFLCKICIPDWSPLYYKGAFITQPWHNPTYTTMRFFALITMALYFGIQSHYIDRFCFKEGAAFCLALLFTNYSKPNFVIAFAPIMLAMLIKDFIRTKTKSFKNAFMFGVCVLLACTIMIYQTTMLYPTDGSGDSSVAFSLSNAVNFFLSNPKLPLYFVLNFAFPIYVSYLVIRNRNTFDKYDKQMLTQTWAMYFVAFAELLFITETGRRANDGNFGWGGFLWPIWCL